MAYLIPDNLASRSDVPRAVQEVASSLRDFVGDDVTVVYRTDLDDSPLIVIDPSAGVVAIHVVQGGSRGLRKGLLARFRAQEPSLDELREQVPTEAVEALDRVRSSKHLDRDVPVVAVHAAPTVSRTLAARQGLPTDGMLLQEDFRQATLSDALARVLGGRIAPLRDVEERAVRAAVTPQIIINDPHRDEDSAGRIVFRAPETGGEDVLTVLDRQQHNLALHLGDGYRVIRGVAGSGKTLVLTYRARFLAEADPRRRILVTCYNRALAAALQHQLADLPSVDVINIDRFAYRIAQDAKYRTTAKDRNARTHELRLAAKRALETGAVRRVHDVVLVDEGQDLDSAALDLAYAALKPGAQDFVIALDAAQNIYRKRGRWNPPGITARGRTTVMKVNYRNTKEILELAYRVLSRGGEVSPGEGGLDDEGAVVVPEAAYRRGPRPVIRQIANPRDETRLICDRLEELHRAGIAWSDIVVLFGNTKTGGRLYYATEERGIPYHNASYNSQAKSQIVTCGDKVRGATFHTMKGLESSHVLICGVNNIWAGDGDDDDVARRRLLYVGMTRATDLLEIFVAGSGPLGADVIDAAAAA